MKQLYKIGFLCFFLFSFWPSFGEEKTFPAEEIQSIIIKAGEVNLKLKHSSSPLYRIKWTGDISFQIKEGLLIIQSSDFDSKKAWRRSRFSAIDIEISGPSRPLKFFSYSSKAFFSGWTEPLFLSSFKGEVKAFQVKAPLNMSVKKGSFSLTRGKGPVSVRGFHIEGLLAESEGDFDFQQNEGRLKVKQSKGSLSWITNKAEVRIAQFEGDVKGFSQSGAVQAILQPEVAELATGSAPIRISFIKRSPKITARSENGRIYGARNLARHFSGKSTQVSGWLHGALKKGSVSLKSETGSIYIN